jgi:hypothetical protein
VPLDEVAVDRVVLEELLQDPLSVRDHSWSN